MPILLALACVLGPIGGLFELWLSSHLVHITGRWIGGTACREHLKTAISWAAVPFIASMLLWIPGLTIIGSEMFANATPRLDSQPLLLIPFLALGLGDLILGSWSVLLLCNTIAEIQGFRSAWRGFGNLLLSFAVILIPLLAVFALLVLLKH